MTTPAPDSGRAADENELREALITFIADRFWRNPGQAANHADALLSGPLAPILQEATTARKERDEARAENARLHDERDVFEVKLDGSEARVRILHEHMDWWRTKAKSAEQEAATLRARLQEAEKVGERRGEETMCEAAAMVCDVLAECADEALTEAGPEEAERWQAAKRCAEELAAAIRSLATPVQQTQEAGAWPSGCIKPNSCSRHRQCMYAGSVEQCRHFGKDLTTEVEAAKLALLTQEEGR